MLKRALALTLALVMLLMPMTASAVTWSSLVTGLRNNVGNSKTSYDEGGTTISVDPDVADETHIIIEGGEIVFDEAVTVFDSKTDNSYYFQGITADKMIVRGADDQNLIVYLENSSKVGDVYGYVGEKQDVELLNSDGSTVDNMRWKVSDGGIGAAVNQGGTVTTTLSGTAVNGGKIEIGNVQGSVGEMSGVAIGEGSAISVTNVEDSTAGLIYVEAAGGSNASVVNEGEAEILSATLSGGSTISIQNDSTIGYATVDSYDSSKITFSGNGSVTEGDVYINVPSTDTYSPSEITAILKAINLPNAQAELWTMDENGQATARYAVTENGELVLLEVFEEEEEEPEEEPDPVEIQRQLEGIGGVTTSPVWNWQGYLGHSSKPMWIYVNGEKTLMRQRLFWLGDATKNHTCRINVAEPDPASIELRVGLDMLRTAQRAEISLITILDKEENPVAQFAVSDLLAAFEQYGLVEGELLCVSGDANAEVMKVTLAGEYLPLEEKAK